MNNVPPNSIDAEICVLGSMILRDESLHDGVLAAKREWFFRPAHQHIFDALMQLEAAGTAVDLVMLKNKLLGMRQFESIGGAEYLQALVSGTPNARSIEYYADIMCDRWTKRELISAASSIVSDSYDPSTQAESLVGNAYAAIQAIDIGTAGRAERPVGEVVGGVLDNAREAGAGKIAAALPTGLPGIDRMLTGGGLRPGQLMIIAARTSVGKSMVAGDIARHIARNDGGVLFVSAEMTAEECVERHMAAMTNVFARRIASGDLSSDDWDVLDRARRDFESWRMNIIDRPLSIPEIAAAAKRTNAKWNGGLDAVFVDYLGLMRPADTATNREQQVGGMALACKQAAAEMGLPWIVLHQINRSGAEGSPQLHHLRDSGQIEEHANTVLLLDQPSNEAHGGDWKNGGPWVDLSLCLAKQRGGETNSWDNAVRRKLRGRVTRTEAIL